MRLRSIARLGGFLYLLVILLGLFEEVFVRSRILVPGDTAATAANLRSLEFLWRLGIAAEFVLLICATSLTVIFYLLLRPVSRELALLTVFFNLISLSIEGVAALHLLSTLTPVSNASWLAAFPAQQLEAMAVLSARSHAQGFGGALIFFGCVCILLGYLIFKSGYFPKTIGVLMQIAGACYLINSFALVLSPPLASRLFPAILLPPLIGEASFSLWLLIRGVDDEHHAFSAALTTA